MMDNKVRCKWCNLKNQIYIKYHDEEWCRLNMDDQYLYEMLILESFQAGLSWECVLNKRKILEKHLIILILTKSVIMITKKYKSYYPTKT